MGYGWSTAILSENIDSTTTLTSIEHDPVWFNKVYKQIPNKSNIQLILKKATGYVGHNATIEEEDPKPLMAFIHAVDGKQFDMIFVDGYARCACMVQAKQLLNPAGIVILHDAERYWYASTKLIFYTYGTIGSCNDYPGPWLWWGGNAKTNGCKLVQDEMQSLI